MANKTRPILPLLLEKKPVELVKPSKHTPSEILSFSTLDNDLFNEVMYATIYVFKANEKNQNDPVPLFRKALSELLVYYYPLSGKLMRRESDRKLQVVFQGEGVPFEVATASLDLSSLNYIEDLNDQVALRLVPEIEIDYDSNVCYHPLALQVAFHFRNISENYRYHRNHEYQRNRSLSTQKKKMKISYNLLFLMVFFLR